MVLFRPLGARLLVQLDPVRTHTANGFIIPEKLREPARTGTVVAVGDGKLHDGDEMCEITNCVGDRVIISSYGGLEVELDEGKFLIVKQNDILGTERV